MNVYPVSECIERLREIRAKGGHFYVQFNCNNCGEKQTMEQPDKLYRWGTCQECGHATNIKLCGMNYMVVFSREKR